MIAAPYSQNFAPEFAGGTLYVDNVYGNDSTGTRNRADLPFRSIVAANRASQWGDLISIVYGSGFCNDPANLACMAGRSYSVAPMVLFTDVTLNAPPVYFNDLTMGSSNTLASSSTLQLLQTNLLVGRELVLLGGLGSGSIFVAGRYKIVSVDDNVLTLNAPFPSYTSGTAGGYGYLAPGPMWAEGAMNGQYDGMLQGQRFADTAIGGTDILLQTGGTVVTTAGQSIATANPEVFVDGATEWIPNAASNTGLGGASPVTWTGPLSGSTGGGALTGTSPSNLGRAVNATAPTGTCTMIFTTRLPDPVEPDLTGRICGSYDPMGGSDVVCYAQWETSPFTIQLITGTGTETAISVPISSQSAFNAYAVMQELSSGDAATSAYVGNAAEAYGASSGTNSGGGSVSNYMVGWDASESFPGIEVGHYLFFDGAISNGKMFAWLNACLQDYGLY